MEAFADRVCCRVVRRGRHLIDAPNRAQILQYRQLEISSLICDQATGGARKSFSHRESGASATVCADYSGIRAATANLVNRSIIVKMYLFPGCVSGSEVLP